jgi:hypothetical protein
MSAREPKKKQQKAQGRDNAQGFYVYCIAERDRLARVFEESLPVAIESGAALEMVAQGNLAAVMSPIALADYGEDALRERLADATWTAIRAMRHEKVVEHFARSLSVVPLRFGTIYLERGGVEQMLSEKQIELCDIIERLSGREEWGLNIYCDRAKLLENITQVSPRLRELDERANLASPGQSYLMRKKISTLRETEARAEVKRVAGEVERELLKGSKGVKRLRVLKDEATEHGELASKFAFLVERTRFDDFRSVAERIAEEKASAGFQLELTGPWPAYNFAVSE